MFNTDAKTMQRMAQMMQRVLVVDPHPAAAKMLSDLLRDIAPCQIWTAPDVSRGLALASKVDPHVVFADQSPGVDGAAFTRHLRRSDYACRRAPVIMVTSEATASAIINARDAGVHEFLRKPYTIRDLLRRIEAVTLRQRDWVEAVAYVGPDRRRFNSGDYTGPLKRRVDHAETPGAARIVQALKILKAAVQALQSDPRQALRAMLAQSVELQTASLSVGDLGLRAAAVAFQQKLLTMDSNGLRRIEIEPLVNELWAFMPEGERKGASAAA